MLENNAGEVQLNIAYLFIGKLKMYCGVHKKIQEQINQWRMIGHTVRIFHVSIDGVDTFSEDLGENVFETISNILIYKISSRKEIERFADVVYMRYCFVSLDLIRLLRSVPAVMEINSDDVAEFRLELASKRSIKKLFKYYWNFFSRRMLMPNVAAKVCVTNELKCTEKKRNPDIPVAVVPNAIIDFPKVSTHIPDNDIPRMVFIGSPNQGWHGVDKIVFLAKASVGRLRIDVIGMDIDGRDNPENISFRGYLSRDEYSEIIQHADIGIGSLALHRKHLDEACPLKVREYLSYGLPVIVGYKDTAFYDEDVAKKLEWVLELPNKETNVVDNISRIVNFAWNNKGKRVNPDDLAFMKSEVLERKRLDFLQTFINMEHDRQ